MSIIRNRKAVAACAVLALAFPPALVMAGQTHSRFGHDRNRAHKAITFDMPPCPIEAKTVPPTKTEFQLPDRDPLREPLSVAGTVQLTDQTSSTVFLIESSLAADETGISFARTVKTLQHATGELTFDKGCTKTDPYGSNNCQWVWGETIEEAHQDALQEDITGGKVIVDLKINTTTPLQFSCAVCGAPCTVQIPQGIDHGQWNGIWDLAISLFMHQPQHDGDGN